MKKCGACGDWKELSEFHKDKSQKDWHCRVCKLCKNAAGRKYYADNADLISKRTKEYFEANPHKKADRNEKKKEWRLENPEERAARQSRWYEANKERVSKYQKEWYLASKEKKAKNRKNNDRIPQCSKTNRFQC